MTEAFDKASGQKTPWNPSRKATKRVTNVIPAPTVCPFCGSAVEIVENKAIYGRNYGEWPWAYRCTDTNDQCCDSYVGMHPFTSIPLGTLADPETRAARKQAKNLFNPIWQGGSKSRTEAYTWLAGELGITVGQCHFGWFDIQQCQRVTEIITSKEPQK